ncbi:hypothetical protein BCR44DRAFT_48885, partial [Catenaria anguillulae PL171]
MTPNRPHRHAAGAPFLVVLLVLTILAASPTFAFTRQPPPPPTKPTLPTRHEYKLSLRRPFYFADPTILSNSTAPGSGNHPDDPDPP